MTSHDITFCANAKGCPQHQYCRRAFPPSSVEWLSFSNFYNPDDGECNMYWPTVFYVGQDPKLPIDERAK